MTYSKTVITNIIVDIIFFYTIHFFNTSSANEMIINDLPFSLYYSALTENPEYDSDFDYEKLKSDTIYLKNFLINKDTSKIITRVVVKKSLYRLFLYQNNILIKTYIIALGKNPVGHKQYEGDQKTPEGKYILDYIKLNSNYYKSFHISYPNANDIKHAESMGRSPGGMIMVHGQPKYTGKKEDFVPGIQASNWTNGCIALLNEDMDEFIQLVKPGTIIEIEP